MIVLDPKNLDTADLLYVLRSIEDRLSGLDDRLTAIEVWLAVIEDKLDGDGGKASQGKSTT